jgi:folate-binding protein YgfZ
MRRAGDSTLIRVAGPTPRYCSSARRRRPERSGRPPRRQARRGRPGPLGAARHPRRHPDGPPETSDAFVPQMANMQLIDGVSFHKGCYTGQEVVARMQYLGKLKRRMYLAEVETDARPRPATC